MRKVNFKRQIIALLGGLLFIISLHAQILDIPILGQKNSQWCWAASLEMVMDFHDNPMPGIEQCQLARDLVESIYNTSHSLPFSDSHPTLPCDCGEIEFSGILTQSQKTTYNARIPFSSRGGQIQPQYIDQIFSKYGYDSIEDIYTERMDWDAIRAEISACRPFLVFLNKLNPSTNPHVVVAKGFYEGVGNKFIVINDPQAIDTCEGCEYLVPISVFSNNAYAPWSALEVVRSIQPRTMNCPSNNCFGKSVSFTSELISAFEQENELLPLTGIVQLGRSCDLSPPSRRIS